MTNGCGWGSRAPPARPATPHAWSERPSRSRRRCCEYYRLGIHSFLLRGFENPHDTVAIGRDLIPLIKAGAIEIDREMQAAE